MKRIELTVPDPLLTSELLAAQDQVSRLLNNLQSVGTAEPGLDAEAEALRIVQDKLHAALTRLTGPNAAKLSPLELRTLVTEATAAVSRAAPIIAAATNASVEAHIEMQGRIAAYRDGAESMRAIYEEFQKERTTPADPAIQQEVRDALHAYREALRSGDERRIARATLDLDEAQLRDLAYAVGRGDPKAQTALPAARTNADKRFDTYRATERAHGAADDKLSADLQALRAKRRDRIKEALERGAKDAERAVTDQERSLIDAPDKGPAGLLTPKVKAEIDGVGLSTEIRLAEASPTETHAPAARDRSGKPPAQLGPA